MRVSGDLFRRAIYGAGGTSRVGLARSVVRARPPIQGCSLAKGAKPALAGFSFVVPLMVRAGRPRSRVGPARRLLRANGSHAGLVPRMVRQTGLSGVLFRRATYGAGGTPAFPGGSGSQPIACKRPPIQGHPLAWRAKPAFTGLCCVVALLVRAGRPRSRVGLARSHFRANGFRSRDTPSCGAPNRPLGVLFCRATYGAGGTPAFPGGSRSQACACKQPPIQGHPLAWRAKPALAGICSVVPLMVRAGRPRSRVGLARSLLRANGLPCRATPSHGAPNRPWRGSLSSCHLWCGRDARAPGWVWLAGLCVQTGSDPGLLPRTARQTGLGGDLFRRATYGAGGTPAFPGGSRS